MRADEWIVIPASFADADGPRHHVQGKIASAIGTDRSRSEVATQTTTIASADATTRTCDHADEYTQTDTTDVTPPRALSDDHPLPPLHDSLRIILDALHSSALDDDALAELLSADNTDTADTDTDCRIVSTLTLPSRAATMSATSVSSNISGALIATTFGSTRHVSWCAHQSALAVWSMIGAASLSPAPQHLLELSACATCAAFHPAHSHVVAVGLFTGQIRFYNLSAAEEPLLAATQTDDLYHREPITSLHWYKYRPPIQQRGTAVSPTAEFYLLSTATDGKTLHWTIDGKHPSNGAILVPNETYSGLSSSNRHTHIGITAAAISCDGSIVVVGSEGGGVIKGAMPTNMIVSASTSDKSGIPSGDLIWRREAYALIERCDLLNKAKVKQNVERYAKIAAVKVIGVDTLFQSNVAATLLYPSLARGTHDAHVGPVSAIAFHPTEKEIFVTAASDRTLYVRHAAAKSPLITIAAAGVSALTALAWSTARETVFAVGTAGPPRVLVYDLMHSTVEPMQTLNADGDADQDESAADISDARINSLCWSRGDSAAADDDARYGRLIAADSTGRTLVWRLSQRINTPQPDERQTLRRLISGVA